MRCRLPLQPPLRLSRTFRALISKSSTIYNNQLATRSKCEGRKPGFGRYQASMQEMQRWVQGWMQGAKGCKGGMAHVCTT